MAAERRDAQGQRIDAQRLVGFEILELGQHRHAIPTPLEEVVEGRYESTGTFWFEPGSSVELLDLGQCEVVDEPAARCRAAFGMLSTTIWEHFPHVCGPFERSVVQTHQHAVSGDLQVVLNAAGLEPNGELE